ncbi:deoxyribonuclease [Beluga whale alphaherpesvirus 1]|uniref:Deoxyribonuclease n=1 Tax=Beluga whale alphaherpesvirus 1 TaxID=1434720 RepID=A0A286MM69_9ALPH|nr:deoxyribonuclease [Beluga whale alphaherpesvirus 1]ASW27095.1 deoxyribonuclease [Beluga whale alphaherpesvirus 1]
MPGPRRRGAQEGVPGPGRALRGGLRGGAAGLPAPGRPALAPGARDAPLPPQPRRATRGARAVAVMPGPAGARLDLPVSLPPEIMTFAFEDYAGRAGPPANLDPLAARMGYLRELLRRLEAHGLLAAGAAARFGARGAARAALLAVEAATREQARCDLWHLLRRSLVTASTIRWGPKSPLYSLRLGGAAAPEFPDTDALAFGRANEPLVRGLVGLLCVSPGDVATPDGLDGAEASEDRFIFDPRPDPPAPYGCGLLIDLRTGVIGASLDMLVCDRDARERLAPHHTQTELAFFEIKCRAKYLFAPDDGTPLAAAHGELLRRKSAEALRDFIRAARRPGVEYFAEAKAPGTYEALVTCDPAWRPEAPSDVQRRCTGLDRRHLDLNLKASSDVWLFNEPDPVAKSITPARWDTGEASLRIPVLANPRHANFKQILVQKYVLSGYFPDRELRPFLVTYIGRRRRPTEARALDVVCPGAGGWPERSYRIPSGCSIPVLLIVTPVEVDDARVWDGLQTTAREAFASASSELWDRRPPAAAAAAGTSS